jgi:hypothetical protein
VARLEAVRAYAAEASRAHDHRGLTLAAAIAIGVVGIEVAGELLYKRRELEPMNNIVLVHGAFVDGGHWEWVYKILKRDGHSISVVQKRSTGRYQGIQDDIAISKLAN